MTRNSEYVINLRGWVVKTVRSKTWGLDRCWDNVLKVADGAGSGGAHIVAVQRSESDRQLFVDRLRYHHRISWLDSESIQEYGRPEFTARVERVAQFEREWRDALRPTVDSPLMLPESSFTPIRCAEMWKRVNNLSLGSDNLENVLRLVKEFRRVHRTRGIWKDDEQLHFVSNEHHAGEHLSEKWLWKFTGKLPRGFHFNVSHANGDTFVVCDLHGNWHERGEYTNIDAHGSVRGGR